MEPFSGPSIVQNEGSPDAALVQGTNGDILLQVTVTGSNADSVAEHALLLILSLLRQLPPRDFASGLERVSQVQEWWQGKGDEASHFA